MSIISILKKVLSIGLQTVPAIAAMVNPVFGALLTTVINSVLKTEAKMGAGNGAAKLDAALDLTDTAVPAIVALIETSTGKELVDNELFANGMTDVHNGVVKILNAFRVLPNPATP